MTSTPPAHLTSPRLQLPSALSRSRASAGARIANQLRELRRREPLTAALAAAGACTAQPAGWTRTEGALAATTVNGWAARRTSAVPSRPQLAGRSEDAQQRWSARREALRSTSTVRRTTRALPAIRPSATVGALRSSSRLSAAGVLVDLEAAVWRGMLTAVGSLMDDTSRAIARGLDQTRSMAAHVRRWEGGGDRGRVMGAALRVGRRRDWAGVERSRWRSSPRGRTSLPSVSRARRRVGRGQTRFDARGDKQEASMLRRRRLRHTWRVRP